MRRLILLVLLMVAAVLNTGCGGSSSGSGLIQSEHDSPRVTPPNNDNEHENETEVDIPQLALAFGSLPEYAFEDFAFDEPVLYWEVREGPMASSEEATARTGWRFDDSRYDTLTDEQREQVTGAESNAGFLDGCKPDYCAIFGAAMTEGGLEVQSSDAELLALFGTIDSEAKLNMWLWANDYQGLTYEPVDSGYAVIAQWIDPMCVEDKYYRLFIDTNGVITETEVVATQAPEACA